MTSIRRTPAASTPRPVAKSQPQAAPRAETTIEYCGNTAAAERLLAATLADRSCVKSISGLRTVLTKTRGLRMAGTAQRMPVSRAPAPRGSRATLRQQTLVSEGYELHGHRKAFDKDLQTPAVQQLMQRYGLTLVEARALRYYTWSNEWINQYLARPPGAPPDEYKEAQIAVIQDALAKLPTHEGLVFRGSIDWYGSLSALRPGDVWSPGLFMSCAESQDVVVRNFDMPVYLVIHSKSGRSIEAFAPGAYEKEVLIPPGAKYEVLRAGAAVRWKNLIADRGSVMHLIELKELD